MIESSYCKLDKDREASKANTGKEISADLFDQGRLAACKEVGFMRSICNMQARGAIRLMQGATCDSTCHLELHK